MRRRTPSPGDRQATGAAAESSHPHFRIALPHCRIVLWQRMGNHAYIADWDGVHKTTG